LPGHFAEGAAVNLPAPGDRSMFVERHVSPLPEDTMNRPLLIALAAITGILSGAGLGTVLVCVTSPTPALIQPNPSSVHSPPLTLDPFPECKQVRRWLRNNNRDPGTVEIIKWEERREFDNPACESGFDSGGRPVMHKAEKGVVIRLRYRTANKLGGRSVEVREFIFYEDYPMLSVLVEELP
jgi:hypothetical protein